MDNSAIDQLIATNPALKFAKIRVDKETQQASVIEVVMLVTGQKNNEAGKTVQNLNKGNNRDSVLKNY